VYLRLPLSLTARSSRANAPVRGPVDRTASDALAVRALAFLGGSEVPEIPGTAVELGAEFHLRRR
jgi:hypothetical protein